MVQLAAGETRVMRSFKHKEAGITLLEVMLSILVIGIMIPAIFGVILSIEKSAERVVREQRITTVMQTAIESFKAQDSGSIKLGEETISDYMYKGYEVTYNVSRVSGFDELYEVNVVLRIDREVASEFTFLFSPRGV